MLGLGLAGEIMMTDSTQLDHHHQTQYIILVGVAMIMMLVPFFYVSFTVNSHL